ncbi:hypothetical protein JD79_03108 [Geodermatophilus normandii]|uniref:Uncharacterized protein n=1 Tax=Geodermatophilus normandii TaxID=1137989 RepID=A0A317QMM0_9ACTN|nr:hypothetical protein [Geodermatophilus normandii]PWW23931.1 hypothetical protein JD79_03108 [Geodermatophilus normandii]
MTAGDAAPVHRCAFPTGRGRLAGAVALAPQRTLVETPEALAEPPEALADA